MKKPENISPKDPFIIVRIAADGSKEAVQSSPNMKAAGKSIQGLIARGLHKGDMSSTYAVMDKEICVWD